MVVDIAKEAVTGMVGVNGMEGTGMVVVNGMEGTGDVGNDPLERGRAMVVDMVEEGLSTTMTGERSEDRCALEAALATLVGRLEAILRGGKFSLEILRGVLLGKI